MAQKGKNKVKIVVIGLISLYAIICGSLYFFQENIIFRPTVLSQDFIYKFSHPFQEIFLKAEDGGIINAVLFKNENPKGVILYFHGNVGDLNRWGKITEYFANKNCNKKNLTSNCMLVPRGAVRIIPSCLPPSLRSPPL